MRQGFDSSISVILHRTQSHLFPRNILSLSKRNCSVVAAPFGKAHSLAGLAQEEDGEAMTVNVSTVSSKHTPIEDIAKTAQGCGNAFIRFLCHLFIIHGHRVGSLVWLQSCKSFQQSTRTFRSTVVLSFLSPEAAASTARNWVPPRAIPMHAFLS